MTNISSTKQRDELLKAISEHRFKTMHEEAQVNSVKILWVLGTAIEEIMPLIDQYTATAVLEARIEEVNRQMDADDANDVTTYYPLSRLAELLAQQKEINHG